MSIPEQIEPQCLADYLAIISRAVFQASLSWKQIENNWDSYLVAFQNFDPHVVALFDEAEIDKLMEFPGVIHSRKKISATIKNAKAILELDEKHGGFANYLRSKSSYEELSKDIRKKFSFMGELSVYYFLFRVKEPVPDFEQWSKTIEGEHPRMREMVDAARK
jgi:3-methyladenine DNA glycosylase Tag